MRTKTTDTSGGVRRKRANDSASTMSVGKLIIALDLGTTYSGISYCFSSQREPNPIAIMNWPGSRGRSAPKIPTVVNYGKMDFEQFQWGALVDKQSDRIVGVKLLLDPSQEAPLYLPSQNVKRIIKVLPKAPVNVAADFIVAIYQHALLEISKAVPKTALDLCQKEYVMTVPAVGLMQQKMPLFSQAAEIAGISPVTLIKEPEAAALYTIRSLDFSIKPNDAFVICDAGGGTVDLVSYEVEAVRPKLQLKELVPGTGAMCGSLTLNKLFAEAVSNLVGDEQWFGLKKSRAFFIADTQFDEEIKKDFTGKLDEEYFVNFPTAGLDDDPDNGLESNCWRLTGTELKTIFDPVIQDVLRLIKDQVQSVQLKRQGQNVLGVFLVGGFGSSRYLRERIQKEYPSIQIIQPDDAWAAIVKGAVLSKLPRQAVVTCTSATRHYGVEASHRYDWAMDDAQPTFKSKHSGEMMVNRMTWYIKTGDGIHRDQRVKFPHYRCIDEDYLPSDLIFTDVLYHCEDKVAPSYRSNGQKLDVNCELVTNLQGAPKTNFSKKKGQFGKPYWEVHYDLVVTLESALMRFSVEAGGKEVGTVDVKF